MSATWTADGLEYVDDELDTVAEDAGFEEAQTLDAFIDWITQQRFAALDAWYTSDCTDHEAYGEAVALLYVNHALAAEGVDVKGRTTWPDERPDYDGDDE